ncbi:hypothetical protein [Streptomyces griseochromogenes]|uniref:hypothetical protein n=1 Tax=Streptomyces griseochromogenes TaxID=68214 RepID=UPI0037B2001E
MADMVTLGEATDGPDAEQRILALVGAHRSAIAFANSRRLAERLTTRLNELVVEPAEAGRLTRFPAEAIGESGIAFGAPPVVARAHQGSICREQAIRRTRTGHTANRRQP